MSIILDALKKAEKERSPSEGAREKNFNPVIEPEKKFPQKGNLFRLLPYAALPVLVLILGFLVYRSPIFDRTIPTTPPKPMTPGVSTDNLEEKVDKFRKEAMSLFKEGKMGESADKWAKAAKLNPEDAWLQNNLGVALKKAGKKEEASTAYEQALKLKPAYAEASNNLGALLMEKGDLAQAKNLFEKAISARGDYAEPHFHLALVLEKEGKKSEAKSHYESFLALTPDLVSTLKSQVEFRILKLK